MPVSSRKKRMLEALDQFGTHEHRPQEGAALGTLVVTRWEVQAGPDGSVKGWLGLYRPATSAISTTVMDTLAVCRRDLRVHAGRRERVHRATCRVVGNLGARGGYPLSCLEASEGVPWPADGRQGVG